MTSHVRVKRLTDTFFVAIDVKEGTAGDLLAATSRLLDIPQHSLRLCRVCDSEDRVDFLDDGSRQLLDLGIGNDTVLCAVMRTENGWEAPCVVEFPKGAALAVRNDMNRN